MRYAHQKVTPDSLRIQTFVQFKSNFPVGGKNPICEVASLSGDTHHSTTVNNSAPTRGPHCQFWWSFTTEGTLRQKWTPSLLHVLYRARKWGCGLGNKASLVKFLSSSPLLLCQALPESYSSSLQTLISEPRPEWICLALSSQQMYISACPESNEKGQLPVSPIWRVNRRATSPPGSCRLPSTWNLQTRRWSRRPWMRWDILMSYGCRLVW